MILAVSQFDSTTESSIMLQDPISLATGEAQAALHVEAQTLVAVPADEYRLQDLTPTGSVRTDPQLGAGFYGRGKFTINHSTTKENGPYVTERTVIGIDHTVIDVNGRPVTSRAYMVVANPIVPASLLVSPIHTLAYQIAQFVLFGGLTGNSTGVWDADNAQQFLRVLGGEP